MSEHYAEYAGDDYDRIQPVKIEHYAFYHDLAFDYIPFEPDSAFRYLDLGCGTGVFLTRVLEAYPRATCLALDFSDAMLETVSRKNTDRLDRLALQQRDLETGLPADVGTFDLVASFSTIHHLTDDGKRRVFEEVHDALSPGGWFLLMDAMIVHFDDDVWRLGRERNARRQQERFAAAGIDLDAHRKAQDRKRALADDSPERDRIARLADQLDWLRDAGFASVDHVWHYWMEHLIIARKAA